MDDLKATPTSPSIRSTHAKKDDRIIATHRSLFVCSLLLCSSFTLFNVHVGYKSLNTFHNRQLKIYDHDRDEPHSQQRQKGKSIASTYKLKPQRKAIPIIEHETIHAGKYITQILRGEIDVLKTSKMHRFKFQPGTLEMTSTEAIRHCQVNTTQYEQHFATRGKILVSLSKTHKLIYRNIPKSASSSSRHAMKNLFNGEDIRIKVEHLKSRVENDEYQVISFIRDPLNRFFSSYDEAYFRKGPWFGEGRLVKNRPGEVKGYLKTKHKLEPYPYLYEGMKTYNDYRDKFCDRGNDKDCETAETIDDGDLTRRFEQFVNDYSGIDPFDVHLSLQVPFLVAAETGKPLPISMLYNASNADTEWLNIAQDHDLEVSEEALVHGRKTPRRINMSLVTDATKRKICKKLMLDYCCLNIELPEVCKYEVSEEEATGELSCAMETRHNDRFVTPWKSL